MSRELRLAELKAFNDLGDDKSSVMTTEDIEALCVSSGNMGLSIAEINRKIAETTAQQAADAARPIVDDGSPGAQRDIVQRDTAVEIAKRNRWILQQVLARK